MKELFKHEFSQAGDGFGAGWGIQFEYTLQRSNTGNAFEDVVTIPAAGQSSSPLHYSYNDNTAFPNKTYYRLKQTDRDGKFTYSNIITAGCNPKEQEVSLFPNPAIKEIIIILKDNTKKVRSLSIIDASGRIIKQVKPLAPSGNITVDVRTFQKGIYWVRIDTDNGEMVTRFIKLKPKIRTSIQAWDTIEWCCRL